MTYTCPVSVTTNVKLAVEIVKFMSDKENCKFGLSPNIFDTSLGGFFRRAPT